MSLSIIITEFIIFICIYLQMDYYRNKHINHIIRLDMTISIAEKWTSFPQTKKIALFILLLFL